MEQIHGPNCPCHSYKLTQNDDLMNDLIDLTTFKCLNESKTNSCRSILIDLENKYNLNPNENLCLSFQYDPELVFIIYFTEEIKLRAINFITNPLIKPSYLGVYLNEDNVSFDITEETPEFQFDCNHFTEKNEIEFYVNPVKCSNLRSLILHFKGDQKQVGIHYLGLKGYGNSGKRFIVKANYEVLNKAQEKKSEQENLDARDIINQL